MPGEAFISRVSKSDFFAILGSGTYVVGNCGLLLAAVVKRGSQPTAYETLNWSATTMERHWSVVVGFLFLAFLVGNVLRAFRVNVADTICKRWFSCLRMRFYRSRYWPKKKLPTIACVGAAWLDLVRRKRRHVFERQLHRPGFPYVRMLEGELNRLKMWMPEINFTIPCAKEKEKRKSPIPHTMYNFWKMSLCRKGGPTFEFTQQQEGRVRLFATMFWASLWSMLPGAAGVLLSALGYLGKGWGLVTSLMFCLSAVICFVFGSQLRRVRGQEAGSLFLAYVSLYMDKTPIAGDTPEQPQDAAEPEE